MYKYFRFFNFAVDDTYTFHSLRLFGCSVWSMYSEDRFGWFRLFGHGLKWKDMSKYKLMFSERQGKHFAIIIKGFYISFL